jgi:hypothetical protein
VSFTEGADFPRDLIFPVPKREKEANFSLMGENHKSQPACFLLFISGEEILPQKCNICWRRLRTENGQRGKKIEETIED